MPINAANHHDQDDESRRSGGPCERAVTSASASAIGPSGKSPDGDRGKGNEKEGRKKGERGVGGRIMVVGKRERDWKEGGK